MGNQYLADMLNAGRDAYITWLIERSVESSANLASWLSKVADYLDCTESQALDRIKGL